MFEFTPWLWGRSVAEVAEVVEGVCIWSCWLEGVALFGKMVVGLVVEMREHSGGKRAGH